MPLARHGRDESVTATVPVKTCSALRCGIGDIMDVVPQKGEKQKKIEHSVPERLPGILKTVQKFAENGLAGFFLFAVTRRPGTRIISSAFR